MNRLTQDNFRPMPFGGSGLNLHVRPSGPAPELVVFVHGLGGKGYKTWADFPALLFQGRAGRRADVAVYDYVTLTRRIFEHGASMDFYVRQLARCINQLESEYANIFLVGHSLGGVVAEQVAMRYLRLKAGEGAQGITPLAALILVAAPIAGSGWALKALQPFLSELRYLTRSSKKGGEADEFFATSVDVDNIAQVRPQHFLLPRFACIAGSDRLVGMFSAGRGVPERQRDYFLGTHSSIAKPTNSNDEQVRWLSDKITEILSVRLQWQREREYIERQSREVANRLPAPPILVTEFWGSVGDSGWEQVYNEVRSSASTAEVAVFDRRQAPATSIDLLIAVSDAEAILEEDVSEKAKLLHANGKREADDNLSVGVSPVGARATDAAVLVKKWLSPVLPGIYIEGASDDRVLYEVIRTWLQIIIDRHPGRIRSRSSRLSGLIRGEQEIESPLTNGGGY